MIWGSFFFIHFNIREETPRCSVWCTAVPVCLHTEAIKVLLENFSQRLHKGATMMSETALHVLKKRCARHMSLLQWFFKGAHCCHEIRSCCLGPEPWDVASTKMTQAPCCHHPSSACKAWPWHSPGRKVFFVCFLASFFGQWDSVRLAVCLTVIYVQNLEGKAFAVHSSLNR